MKLGSESQYDQIKPGGEKTEEILWLYNVNFCQTGNFATLKNILLLIFLNISAYLVEKPEFLYFSHSIEWKFYCKCNSNLCK